MKLTFTDSAWKDYLWFQERQPQLVKRLNELIKDAKRSGFQGIGKPEPLKGIYPVVGQGASIANIVLFIKLKKTRFSLSLVAIITRNKAAAIVHDLTTPM